MFLEWMVGRNSDVDGVGGCVYVIKQAWYQAWIHDVYNWQVGMCEHAGRAADAESTAPAEHRRNNCVGVDSCGFPLAHLGK